MEWTEILAALGGGPLAVGIAGLAWLLHEERKERRAAQDTLDKARVAHSEAMVLLTKEAMGSLDAMEKVVDRLAAELQRSGRNGG